ncbi:MAG: DUF3341 domain-containing protein [Candidatus Omnitrophota bacterium]
MKRFEYDTKEAFLEKLKAVVTEHETRGIGFSTVTPFDVPEVQRLLNTRPSPVRVYILLGALTGFILGFAFMIFTVLDWPLITGGKPLISIPPFIIVAFETTILFGGITVLIGFLILTRLPSMRRIISPIDSGSRFVIIQETGEEKQ